jgi:HAD superfamily hydrolase (TIGR01459 family)
MPSFIDGLAAIASRYDACLVDLWGTLHDGVTPYPAALDALKHLKAAGKTVLFLSNGPRRAKTLRKRLDEMQVPHDLYDGIVSSGEATWRALDRRDDPFHAALGKRCFHMGPERDNDVREDIGIEIVGDVNDADFVLCTGIDLWDETVAQHEPVLRAALARQLPLVCANPDLVVHVAGRASICAGTIAARYEEWGGRVAYHGKPYPSVYEMCFEKLGDIAPERVLGIGDSLRTDVTGGRNAGCGTLLLTEGIHREEFGEVPDLEHVGDAARALGTMPDFVAKALAW